MPDLLNLVLLLLLLGSALSAVLIRSLMGAVIAFSSYSLVMAIMWQRLQAPDLALTEAAIGAGITTVLFVVTIFKTRGKNK
ncbi:MAG: hydrogenase subunit MbhD domain-containing protein [Chloroflexota bacterium]